MRSALRSLKSLSSIVSQSSSIGTRLVHRLYSALPHSENDEQEPSFDSSNFTLPIKNPETIPQTATRDDSLRKKPNLVASGIENRRPETKISENEEKPIFSLPVTNPETIPRAATRDDSLRKKTNWVASGIENRSPERKNSENEEKPTFTGQTDSWNGSLREKANWVASGIENRGSENENLGNEEKPAFDSSEFTIPDMNAGTTVKKEAWDEKLRGKADRVVGGRGNRGRDSRIVEREEDKRRKAAVLARALLEAALDRPDEEGDEEEEEDEVVVTEEDQMSLNVGIIGAPNAGKSALTNFMVGTKVAAVSRKTNTTTHEVLGVMTNGTTQICFFDTPGIMLKKSGYPSADMKFRVKSAWSSVNLYDVLIVIFDVHRHLKWPDSRVVKLIERMGAEVNPKQKRVLCMNKVDLVEKKKDLLTVAEQFKDLPGYDRYFMISGLKGSGIKDLSQFLMEQAVKRPWDEDPFVMSEEVMKNISLEVVRERMLDHIHQEIPYNVEQRLVDWKELADGSLRIEQHLITPKMSQRKILIGKNGSKIGRIGIEANEELRSIFKINVHLILMVRVK